MKLFKVTYKKLSNPTQNLTWESNQAYYTCDSLDNLYHYIENEQHLTVLSIEILNCTVIETKSTQSSTFTKFKPLNQDTQRIIRAI